jgi:hypothetical protein
MIQVGSQQGQAVGRLEIEQGGINLMGTGDNNSNGSSR